MSRKANPALIGGFVVGAIAIVVVAVLLLAGGGVFRDRVDYVMFFSGSVQGLDVGAPVVFRGVKVGTVTGIGVSVGQSATADEFFIAVTATMPKGGLPLVGPGAEFASRDLTLKDLIDRGLRAQLRAQSLVTGQLYVGLDFRPLDPPRLLAQDKSINEIPTVPTPLENFMHRLEEFPIEKVLKNIESATAAIDRLSNSPEILAAVRNANEALQKFSRLAESLDGKDEVLVQELRSTLQDSREALAAARQAMQKAEQAFAGVSTLAHDGSDVLAALKAASAEIAKAARSIEHLASDDSEMVVNMNRAARELGAAARSTRDLADSLERQPDSLIWGRRPAGSR